MPTAQQDTEITLGTGRMLAIFFAFVLVCAFFFGIGFSLGRRTATSVANLSPSSPAGVSPTIVRPSPSKSEAPQSPPSDMSFYKAVGEKNANTALTPPDSKTQAAAPSAASPTTEASPKAAPDAATAASSGAGYYVQVAAVSRQEDADALVEALKKKQYPAFMASNASTDKFFHVQVGPYAELKDAETMRARLISDGYNPIVKK
jgi:cell division septation protein DedD